MCSHKFLMLRQRAVSSPGSAAATLAAFAALGASAQAALIFSPTISNLAIEPDSDYFLDIDGNGTDDFELFTNGEDFTDLLQAGASGNLVVANPDGFVSIFEVGDSIGSGSGTFGPQATVWNIGDSSPPGLAGLGTSYVGFSFEIGGALHYGWMEFSFPNADPFTGGTLVAAAYQGIAETPAPIVVPEISSWQGLISGVALLILFKRTARRWRRILPFPAWSRKRVPAT